MGVWGWEGGGGGEGGRENCYHPIMRWVNFLLHNLCVGVYLK